jgi:tRNA(Ser,Leu) C12 N-acetylase TAN1
LLFPSQQTRDKKKAQQQKSNTNIFNFKHVKNVTNNMTDLSSPPTTTWISSLKTEAALTYVKTVQQAIPFLTQLTAPGSLLDHSVQRLMG